MWPFDRFLDISPLAFIVHYGGSKGMGKEGSSAKELQKVPKGEDESSIPRYFKASGKGLKPKGGERQGNYVYK